MRNTFYSCYMMLIYYEYNTLILQFMQEDAKLIVAEQFDGPKIEFIVFVNQIVGEGGFGVVKKAIRNDKPNQLLVAKIIPYEDERKRQKIQKQIKILKNLPNHPNLVRVEPLKCYSNNNYYIFMEYCPDGTLEDLRKKKKNNFTEEEIFQIFYQLMNGYRVLYEAKILHQDLKPENVLIKNGIFKLTDFGFSIFYQGVKHGNIREGTLPYMPIQKLTEKQYYATTKSDVYSMGIILFKLITGHHPYVQSKNKEYRAYLKELKLNPLYLRPNFSSRFSIKFQHFFDLILKMVAKNQSARIDFDQVYEYIENEQMFLEIHKRIHKDEQKNLKTLYQKYQITGQSTAIAIDFKIPQTLQEKVKQQIQLNSKNQQNEEQEKTLKQLENYIVSHRIMVYFFDRLTRRIYVEKLRKTGEFLNPKDRSFMEQIILGLLLFCKKIIQGLIKQYKNGIIFSISSWKLYRKSNASLIKMIERDQNYLEELVIDCLSQSSQTKIKQKKDILDKSKFDIEVFKGLVKQQLEKYYQMKKSGLNPNDRQNLITICYISSGIDILTDFKKWESEAVNLQSFFRQIQTQDSQTLFFNVSNKFLEKNLQPVFDLGEED